jgi:SAM-dependent methyltransferase
VTYDLPKDEAVAVWDQEAETFDEPADHGLSDPEVRAAWRDLLLPHLPARPATVADLGCGTGTLSMLLAEEGYAVRGLDFSPEMVTRARAKATTAPHLDVTFAVGDAATPDLASASVDVVLSRHVLWAMPDPAAALRRWLDLLVPGGRLLLVEGRWSNGAGLTADRTRVLVEGAGRTCDVRHLPDPGLWGRAIEDERYLVVSPA